MALKGIMTGVGRLLDKLKGLFRKAEEEVHYSGTGRGPTYRVAYSAPYAPFVHEAVGMKLLGRPRPSGRGNYWDPQPQAGPKFLEGPARELRAALAAQIREDMRAGKTRDEALQNAALTLLRASQERVPVEYGDLKRSGYVRRGRAG